VGAEEMDEKHPEEEGTDQKRSHYTQSVESSSSSPSSARAFLLFRPTVSSPKVIPRISVWIVMLAVAWSYTFGALLVLPAVLLCVLRRRARAAPAATFAWLAAQARRSVLGQRRLKEEGTTMNGDVGGGRGGWSYGARAFHDSVSKRRVGKNQSGEINEVRCETRAQ